MSTENTGVKFPVFVNPRSWAAGVMDAGGQFHLRVSKRTRAPYGTVVRVRCGKPVGDALIAAMGAGTWWNGYWTVAAEDQHRVTAELMPHMREPSRIEGAMAVYKYRSTQPFVGGRGGTLTEAVRRYRKRLVAPTGEHKRTRSERAKIRAKGLTLGGQVAKKEK